MRALALDHVAERIDDSAYLERLGQLRADPCDRGSDPAR